MEQIAGGVVEPVDDFHVVSAGEIDVGEVALPELVRAVRSEPLPGGPRALLRLSGDLTSGGEYAPDRGCAPIVRRPSAGPKPIGY